MNTNPRQTAPLTLFILSLPFGISSGFVSVTLPFILTRHGLSVSAAAAITAFGLSANIWRFLWAPFTDLTLSLHKWYMIGIFFCAGTMELICIVPINNHETGLLTVIVLLSQVAGTFVIAPVGGFMAKTVVIHKKGRASGWSQAGQTGGVGIGGGAGIWLSGHLSYQWATTILSLIVLFCATGLYFVTQVHSEKAQTLRQGFRAIAIDIKQLFSTPYALFSIIVIICPLGIGAAAYIWSSVGNNWHVTADTVALVTGILSGVASVFGSILGGWIADKAGRWWAMFGSASAMAIITIIMGISSFTPMSYIVGILSYAFTFGLVNAAFSAVVLFAIGKGLASTKYALLASIGNIPVVYMTAIDGWLYDSYSIKGMLFGESILGLGFVTVFVLALSGKKFRNKFAPGVAVSTQ